jgi:hypothetical protein
VCEVCRYLPKRSWPTNRVLGTVGITPQSVRSGPDLRVRVKDTRDCQRGLERIQAIVQLSNLFQHTSV